MPSNRFAFVIRYLNHAVPRMQEPRAYARVAPLRERIFRPCIWPSWESHPSEDHSEAPSFVATAHIVGVTSLDRFRPTAKSPLAPPLLLSPSSHLTQREVLPCFNARHQDWTQVSLMLLPVMAFDAVAPHRLSRERLSDAPLIRLAGFPTAEGK